MFVNANGSIQTASNLKNGPELDQSTWATTIRVLPGMGGGTGAIVRSIDVVGTAKAG